MFAEDLGSVPAFVRESMTRLQLPGLKVLRWEKYWDREGQPPIDPATFPELSVATTGTHDIEPLAATPEGASDDQRKAVLQSLLSAGSALTLIPIQDVFGWTDRINTPAVVDDINWTWRLPWLVDSLARSHRDRGARRRAEGVDPEQRAMTDEQPQEPEPQGPIPAPSLDGAAEWLNVASPIALRSCAARWCCSTSGPTAASTACTSSAT